MGLIKELAEPSFKLLKYVILMALFLYILTPLVWLFVTAFSVEGGPYLGIPKEVTLDNFIAVLTNRPVGGTATAAHPFYMTRWITNSFIIAIVTMAVVVLLGVPASYALSRLRFRGKGILMTVILLAGFMPMMAKILPLFRLCALLGLIDNLPGIGLITASGTIPLQIWILKGFFDYIPRDLEEQAWICGYGRLAALFKVVLPAAGPGLAVVAFLSFLSGWGSFTVPLILIRTEYLFPISLGIASVFIHNPGEIGLAVDYGSVCALSVLYAIPALIIYYVFREHLMTIKLAKMEVR